MYICSRNSETGQQGLGVEREKKLSSLTLKKVKSRATWNA
jgi:hypothetical protein